jgi:hypothetical protein
VDVHAGLGVAQPGPRTRWRSAALAVLLGLASVSTVRALEPQALVGAWVGEWNNGLGASNAVYLTVTKVSGDRVEGTLYWQATPGTPSENQDLLFVGTLVGRTLSVRGAPTVPGSPAMSFSCSVSRDGTRMDGFVQGAGRSAVSFAKEKR